MPLRPIKLAKQFHFTYSLKNSERRIFKGAYNERIGVRQIGKQIKFPSEWSSCNVGPNDFFQLKNCDQICRMVKIDAELDSYSFKSTLQAPHKLLATCLVNVKTRYVFIVGGVQ